MSIGPQEDTAAPAFREPEHQVSPRAVSYWRFSALLGLLPVLAVTIPLAVFLPERPWWLWVLIGVVVIPLLAVAVAMPPIRFRVHRWEITPDAIFTRSGWITRKLRIIPLTRVQTVEREQGAVMRRFGLASVTVTTASAAGPITITCLDADVARQAVTELTRITGAAEGDAT
ncbi:MAG: PH domain-containing protein [Nocardioides sp.]|nr:PH domain-containing protein [Nocardioides sp.]